MKHSAIYINLHNGQFGKNTTMCGIITYFGDYQITDIQRSIKYNGNELHRFLGKWKRVGL